MVKIVIISDTLASKQGKHLTQDFPITVIAQHLTVNHTKRGGDRVGKPSRHTKFPTVAQPLMHLALNVTGCHS